MAVHTSDDSLAAGETWSQAPELRGLYSLGTQVCAAGSKQLAAPSSGLGKHFWCPRGSCLLFSLLFLFLKHISFPWRDLLITILWTNHPGCKSLKATQSLPLPLPCSLSRFPCRWKQFLSRRLFLPKQELNAACCLRGHFIIHGNRKRWKRNVFRRCKVTRIPSKRKEQSPLCVTNILSFGQGLFSFYGVVWKQWQDLWCKS